MRSVMSKCLLIAAAAATLSACASAPTGPLEAAEQGGCAPDYRWNSIANRGVILWDCQPGGMPERPEHAGAVVKAD